MSALDNAAVIDGIVDAVEAIVADVLVIPVDDVLESQESDEVEAARGYVSCEAQNIQEMGFCNFRVPLTFTIGFQMPDDGRKLRVQRLEWQMKLLEPLTTKDAIPNIKILKPTDMVVSIGANEPHGYVWGGFTLTGEAVITRG